MTDTIEATAEVIEPTGELAVTYTPAVFDDNLAALDAYVEQQIAPYVGAQIDPADEKQVKEARGCMAALNKLKAPIEDERKRVKRAYEAPLKEFEGRVKAITSKIDKARSDLKCKVDEADERFRQMRRDLLAEEYEGCAGPIADVIPFSAVLDDAWLNRSTPEGKAVNALYEKVEAALKGYKALQAKELAHKDEVVKKYAETLDLVAALELEDELAERDRQMAEFKAKQEAAEAVKREAMERTARRIEQEDPSAHAVVAGDAIIVADRPKEQPKHRWSLSMEFSGTEAYAREVASTLKGIGITGATIKCLGVVGNG